MWRHYAFFLLLALAAIWGQTGIQGVIHPLKNEQSKTHWHDKDLTVPFLTIYNNSPINARLLSDD